jgi:hypothetical protein
MHYASLIKHISLINLAAEWLILLAVIRSVRSRNISAMVAYLAVDAILNLPSNILLNFKLLPPPQQAMAYRGFFWLDFFGEAIAVFFVIHQVFGELLAPLPGLRRMGLIVFRWIAATAGVISLVSVLSPIGRGFNSFDLVSCQICRGIDLMEICLLAFLALVVHTLGLSYRSRVFGIALGFGLSAITDMISTVVLQHTGQMYDYGNLIGVSGALAGITVWAAYLVKQEPARQPITLPTTSPLLRWNEIANALGHKGGQVVIEQPSFFLQDVEGVVDRVLRKNNAVQETRAS